MSGALPAGFLKIEEPDPPEEADEADEPWADSEEPDEQPRYYSHDNRQQIEYESAAFPERCVTGTPEELTAKLYGCSGSLNSTQYREATKLRDLPGMNWDDARVALNRLVADLREYSYRRSRRAQISDLIALAEFALTARGFEFQGRKGESAPRFRKELTEAAMRFLHAPLAERLTASAKHAQITARPITDMMKDGWQSNEALQAMVPLPDGGFVRIIDAAPEQAIASLEFVRHWLAEKGQERAFADRVLADLGAPSTTAEDYARSAQIVTAQEYVEAMRIADGLEFMGAKLVALYFGVMHSIPLYRLHPATPEREAIMLWWPWGRPMPLVDGGPAKAPTTRKKVLDPGIITTSRPQDVVREVMERTGINRTTAQRMTAEMRAEIRRKRHEQALSMLRQGVSRAEVARAVGLSASRISTMFKGQNFPTKEELACEKARLAKYGIYY
jgi:hypothetical protein